jgi:hypothetical protein
MAEPGKPDVIKRWIESLDAQLRRKNAELKTRVRAWPQLVALALLVAWVSVLPIGFLVMPVAGATVAGANWHRVLFVSLLFLSPLIAGASGASIRTLLPTNATPSLKTTVLGVAAGAIASILYVLGQVMGNASPYNFVVLAFSLAFGFIAGFTFDVVFKKLESVQALQSDILTAKRG